jgi:hypothetical protein
MFIPARIISSSFEIDSDAGPMVATILVLCEVRAIEFTSIVPFGLLQPFLAVAETGF